MKIAVASQNKHVAGHFGHCQGFEIFDVEDGIIVNSEFVENPGHIPGWYSNIMWWTQRAPPYEVAQQAF
jgi:predicted Fe-Mo cluster-binding NifX family protein